MTEGERDKPGILVIQADVPRDVEADYATWWDEEHLPQRLECRGLVSARRWIAQEGEPRHLTLFELASISALDTEEYLHLTKNPTDRSRSVVGRIKVGRQVFAERSSAGPRLDPSQVGGLMLVTFDLAEAFDADYEAWYTAHDQDLIKVPGLLRVRRFQGVEGPGQACLIEFTDPDVRQSDAYEAIRSDPVREKLSQYFVGFKRNVYAPA